MDQPIHDHATEQTADSVTDLVCGMQVDPARSCFRATHEGRIFHFCSAGCAAKFSADPQKYLAGKPNSLAAPGASYTCPMHPDIRKEAPGSCPICGMALEPTRISAAADANPELRAMTIRFWGGLALTLPVLVLAMAGHMGLPHLLPRRDGLWVQFALSTPVVLWAGWPFFVRCAASLINRRLNMFTLIALGTGTAYATSVAALLVPGIFASGFRSADGAAPVYFEAAAMITVLVLLGQVLELRARDRTGGALRALLNLAPKTARRLQDHGEDQDVGIDEVRPGDRLRVRPGEAVPVDGILLEGESAIDESMVTGEAMPVTRQTGEKVIGGTINRTGTLVIRAEHVGAETTLARIVDLVARAQRSAAPIQSLADRVSGWFVPAVLLAAALSFAGWAEFGPAPALSHALTAAVSVVIIACPCALGLATPMSIAVAMGMGARAGILIQSAAALERLAAVDTLLIDKTGTLTEGKPRVTKIVTAPGMSEADLLAMAGAVERSSEHSLADAIMAAAKAATADLPQAEDFRAITGKGVTGRVGDRTVALGTATLMKELGVALGDLAAEADCLRTHGATALFVGIDGRAAGVIAIEDPVRPGTRAALDTLRADGLHIVMLTGDDPKTANAIAAQLGIDDVHAGWLPEDKQRFAQAAKVSGKTVAMAGDGVNDAPALAEADVGIAMGNGTDIAMKAAAVVLVKGDLAGIARAIRLSRATIWNIRENLGLRLPITCWAYRSRQARSIRCSIFCFGLNLRRWQCR